MPSTAGGFRELVDLAVRRWEWSEGCVESGGEHRDHLVGIVTRFGQAQADPRRAGSRPHRPDGMPTLGRFIAVPPTRKDGVELRGFEPLTP